MPGIVRRGRKRPSAAVSEDEAETAASSSTSTGSKRARYERDASDESDEAAPTNGSRALSRMQNGYQEDDYREDVHQPGSIVRVTLKNFVTYTAAEFHPGPSLNMVIGPNGTGKSTLVCAICLGLGWDPKNLGRAKEIGEFVKHGNADAFIEIELAAAAGHKNNPVISRKILKHNNKSAFWIDGRQSTQKEVVKLAKSFSIQIDNLCQFLPQDRVVEFAGLQPVDLLRETLRAAAPEHMVQWHEHLKNFRAEQKQMEVDKKNEDAHLEQLQARQNATREDVERWHEHQELMIKSKILEKCRPYIENRVIKKQVEEVKAQRNAAKEQLKQLEAEIAPTRRAQEEMDLYRGQVDQVRSARNIHVDKAKQRADKLAADIKVNQDSITELQNQVSAESAGEKQRRQDVKRLQSTITNFERAMQDAPVELDEDSFKAQMTGLRSQRSNVVARDRQLTNEMTEFVREVNNLRAELQAKKNERANLDTQSGQQASLLQHWSRDTATGWSWIEQHRESLQFKGEVYGPPILTCSVTDPRYADVLESQMGISDATAITCTNGDDSRLLTQKLLGREGLGLHQISIRTVPQPLAFYRSPVTRDELREYGFEGWILDYINGPEPVLAMLCDNAQLYRAAYTSKKLSPEQDKAIEQSPIARYVAGAHKYRITRRKEYGIASTLVTDLKSAKWFTDQPVDVGKKRALDDGIQSIERQVLELRENHRTCKTEQQEIKQEQEQAESEMKAITEERKRKQKAIAEWEDLPNKKAEKQGELESLMEIMRDTGKRILSFKAQSEKTSLKVASLAMDYAKAVSFLRQCHQNLVEAEIRLVEASSEVDSLKAENAQILQALENQKRIVKELEAQRKALTERYNQTVRRIQSDYANLPEEEQVIMGEFSELPTIEDLDNKIDSVRVRLDLITAGINPNAVDAYNKREREIGKATEKAATIAENLEKTKDGIKEVKDQWEPQLDELASKISEGFSHNMAQIGCAGQVRVYKEEEEFEKWAIQIEVRFREGEPLSVLTSQRQSGGERAVSTIFYLMALQDLARSPFRVVDEINQGMDPRNERMVYERMVDIICTERTSQYFLITPKLLTGLKFHPKMTIHCIGSGEHMPGDYKQLDFQKLANIAIRRKRGRAAA